MPDEENKNKEIEDLKNYIKTAEASLLSAKKALADLTGEPQETLAIPNFTAPASSDKIIEGIFDGENMVGPGDKIFPVPANYASKSKLVFGDKLKLSVAEDGSFIFKQIGPAERRKIIGTLAYENNAYHVMAEGKIYKVLYASVTYYKAQNGDRVTLVIPASGDSDWAALDNVIHEAPEKEEFEENILTETDTDNSFWDQTAPKVTEIDTISANNSPVVSNSVSGNNQPNPAPQQPTPVPESAAPANPEPLAPSPVTPSQPQAATEMDI